MNERNLYTLTSQTHEYNQCKINRPIRVFFIRMKIDEKKLEILLYLSFIDAILIVMITNMKYLQFMNG